MGFDFRGFLHVLEAVAPVALVVAGVPPPLIPIITHAIATAEGDHRFEGSGAEKKAHVLTDVSTAIDGINAVRPGTIPAADALTAVDRGIDTTIAVINVIRATTGSQADASSPPLG